MPKKRHSTEEIIGKLREVEVLVGRGGTLGDAVRSIGVTDQTYYRWRKEYGGLKMDQAKRLKELERENTRLRKAVADQPLHVIQRGNDRQAVFFAGDDYARYRDRLIAAAREYGCAVHAYVLMTNHVHLLVTPATAESLPRTMQSLGRRYVRHVNRVHKRTGTLWEGRYRAAPIDSDAYFLSCCRYIELNPVRAGMVSHPRDYPWSSYRAHADGTKDALASDHPLYRRLGRTTADRQQEYRNLFRGKLPDAFVEALRAATNGGWALGDERFKRQIAKMAGRRVAPLPKGRPPANPADKRQLNLL